MSKSDAINLQDFMLQPEDLAFGHSLGLRPLGIVDLDVASDRLPEDVELPPFPVIGLGRPDAPIAGRLDAVIEPPFQIGGVVEAVLAFPVAAAVCVQLLRRLGAGELEHQLFIESLAYGLLQGGEEHKQWMQSRQGAEAVQSEGEVRVTRHGDTLHILLNRPDARNAIDAGMRDALRAAFLVGAMDAGISRIFLRGAGKAFCVGAELEEFGSTRDPALAHLIRTVTLPAHMIARCADKLDVHVQGGCVGAGLEMSAFAGRITATRTAWFQLPELAMGVIPGAGGSVSVSRRIGRQRTALMVLAGRRINAKTALDWGLVDEIVDDDSVYPDGAHVAG